MLHAPLSSSRSAKLAAPVFHQAEAILSARAGGDKKNEELHHRRRDGKSTRQRAVMMSTRQAGDKQRRNGVSFKAGERLRW